MPKLHGVFIGIDRYASPAINWLSCARRDATALHALFADNLPGDLKLLTDKDATRSTLEKELKSLSQCAPDDIVVFAFSGHGTETHELVTYDTDRAKLSATTISLNQLGEHFSKIPARRLMSNLDCIACDRKGVGTPETRTRITYPLPVRSIAGGGRSTQERQGWSLQAN